MCELTYIARATDGLVLAETWDDMQNRGLTKFKTQAKKLLKQLGAQGSTRASVESEGYVFHSIIQEGITYLTLTHGSYPKKLAFAFLEDILAEFQEELKREFGSGAGVDYRSRVETIERAYSFIKFDRVIQRKRQEYRDPSSTRSMQRLNDSLTEVSSIMRKNIDDILQRGDNLEEVGRKATQLKGASKDFSGMAKQLNLQAMLQKYGIVGIVVTVPTLIFIYRFFF
jgi:vesicle transport protein SEC22